MQFRAGPVSERAHALPIAVLCADRSLTSHATSDGNDCAFKTLQTDLALGRHRVSVATGADPGSRTGVALAESPHFGHYWASGDERTLLRALLRPTCGGLTGREARRLMPDEPEMVAGWVLLGYLGHGAFGKVWRGARPEVGLERALKIVPVGSADKFRAWREEVRQLDSFNAPEIVRFYDAGLVDEGPYRGHAWIATELCSHSLHDRLHHLGPLSPEECGELLQAMLAALVAANAKACIHRDIKPANILMTDEGRWKLADFGIARLLPADAQYAHTRIIGTRAYMSAAALRGRQDYAADCYALGVTVHEALTGEVLHPKPPNATDADHIDLILHTPPRVNGDLPADWRNVVEVLIGLHGGVCAASVAAWYRQSGGRVLPTPAGSPPTGETHSPTLADQDTVTADPLAFTEPYPDAEQNSTPHRSRLGVAKALALGVLVPVLLFLLVRHFS